MFTKKQQEFQLQAVILITDLLTGESISGDEVYPQQDPALSSTVEASEYKIYPKQRNERYVHYLGILFRYKSIKVEYK